MRSDVAMNERNPRRPEAIAVMKEIGIDISGHRSKVVNEFVDQSFDHVLTVCDNANESCHDIFGACKPRSPQF